MGTVSVSIVVYNNRDKILQLVDSMLKYSSVVKPTIYIIDNASSDGTADLLEKTYGDQIVLLRKSRNVGFGAGHNSILPLLTSEYHFIVNPDILFCRDTISEMITYWQAHTDIGLLTPAILNLDGSDQQLPKRVPSVLALVGRRIFQTRLKKEVEHFQMLDSDLSKPTDIDFATGCFFGVKTSLFQELHGFDERFFLYFEDLDFTQRVKALQRTVYYPQTCVYHMWERASSHKLKYLCIHVMSMFKYYCKWGWRFRYLLETDKLSK